MTGSNSFQKTVLPDGIRLVSEQITHVRSVALGVWMPLGPRYEKPENSGISHFIEHMAFKGTPTRTSLDIAREIESGGGYVNAFTGKEIACFYVHVLDRHLETAVEVLADILTNPVFAEEMIQHEKTVILEEISDMEDNPEELIHENFLSNLFRDHPLGLPILGRRETVKSFDRDNLLKAFESHRAGDRIVIAAAGNIEHGELSKLITRHFNFNSSTVLEDQPSGNSHQPGRIEFTRDGLIQGHICCGVRGISYSNPDKFPFMLLNTVLGGGMSSRLFQNIREKFGFTYNVYSFADTYRDTGFFGVYMGTDRGKIEEALGLIQQEFDDLRNQLLPDAEMERLKNQLKGNLMLGLEQVSSRMYRLAKMELYLKKYLSLDDILQLIDNVTSEQVRDVANRLLQPDQQLITILTPE